VAERLVPLGKIVATHGLDGWLRLHPYNPATTAFSAHRTFVIEKGGARWTGELESSKLHQKVYLIKFRDIDAIEQAAEWMGSVVFAEADAFEPLAPNEYYHYQAVGLSVFTSRGERIGTITAVWSTAAGEIYIVKGDSKEYLIPAVKEIVEKVDFIEAKIIVNPPEGLFDL